LHQTDIPATENADFHGDHPEEEVLETRRRLTGEFARQAQRDTSSFRSRERFMANRGLTAFGCAE
jgi:hypothetical protein